ncbi:hypothetical protein BJ322DRAFT_1059447 [Thelephora terrestris]|uniref:Uncharacterized protein n=1 Tax=Thelephora terrestris TaxID=56493 RepID=A0A9P6HGD9_9AGAM|nr:hypothetical protein BJ322DRAFT_1059447 [Thelephora terrestris]
MPSPEDTKRDATLVFFGIYTWDYLTSLWFEYRLITRKIRFRWQFATVVTLSIVDVIVAPPMSPFCTRAGEETLMLHLGMLSIVFGTWNLVIRTLIIWGHHPLLMKILPVVGLAQLALALVLPSVGRGLCTPLPPSVVSITVFATTTAVIEFAILLLSVIGIRRASSHGESPLARLLMTQGIAYFVMAFLIQLSVIVVGAAHSAHATRMWVGVSGAKTAPRTSDPLFSLTESLRYYSPCPRTHRIDCLELSEDPGRNPSDGRMTTCIDIDTNKDEGVC